MGDRLDQWIAIGFRARERDTSWIAPSETTIRRQFAAADPLWKTCEHELFGNEDARCVGIVNPRLRDAAGVPYGQVGWFEALGADPAKRMLDDACEWLRVRGCRTVLGPMNGSTWHAYRFVVAPGEEESFLTEPTNPPEYPAWMEAAGFTRIDSAYTSSVQDNVRAEKELAAVRRAAEEKGYRVVPVDLSDLGKVFQTIYEISAVVFKGNPFYSEIGFEEFFALYDGIERLVDPRLLNWLLDPGGKIAGFGFGFPDKGGAVRRMRGQSGVMAKLRYLTGPKVTRSVFKSMGILPEHQGKGLASALFHEQAVRAVESGWKTGIRALMAEGNRSFATGRDLHRTIRTYALFQRTLA